MCTRCVFLGGLAASLAAPALAAPRLGTPQLLEVAMPSMRRFGDTLWLGRLSRGVWLHTTTHELAGVGYYPANGAIVVDGAEALLIDTGWNDADTRGILAAWRRTGGPPVTRALVTHWHRDRLGGIGELQARGISAFGHPATVELAKRAGYLPPRPLGLVERSRVRLGPAEVFFPGAGHTRDNVVAWIPADAVLFGGCLVKSITENDLGYTADGDLHAYPQTLRRVARFRAPRYVVPGHGTIAGRPLEHTIAVADGHAASLRS